MVHQMRPVLTERQVLKQGRPPELDETDWREIIIPVDVPRVHVRAQVVDLTYGQTNLGPCRF